MTNFEKWVSELSNPEIASINDYCDKCPARNKCDGEHAYMDDVPAYKQKSYWEICDNLLSKYVGQETMNELRDNITVEDYAKEMRGPCFSCSHCPVRKWCRENKTAPNEPPERLTVSWNIFFDSQLYPVKKQICIAHITPYADKEVDT